MRDRRPTLVELEAFRATMAEGTTAAAGRRLGRSQSSISRAMAELEQRVGKRLFERRGRLIVPTAEALELNGRLDPVFAALDALRAAPAPEPAEIAVAAPPAFATSLVPRAFAQLRREVPGSRLRLEVVPTPQMVELVAEGGAEIGLTDSVLSAGTVRVELFRESQICCVMPAEHRLAARETITPADLRGEQMIALARRHSMRAQIDALLAPERTEHGVSAEVASVVAALPLIERGVGIGLLNPFPLIGPETAQRLACRPLSVELTYRSAFVLPAHRPASALARRLQSIVKRLVRNDPWSRPVS